MPTMMPAMMHSAYARSGKPNSYHTPVGGLGMESGRPVRDHIVTSRLISAPPPRRSAGELSGVRSAKSTACRRAAPSASAVTPARSAAALIESSPAGVRRSATQAGRRPTVARRRPAGQSEQLVVAPVQGRVGEQPGVVDAARSRPRPRRRTRWPAAAEPAIDEGHRVEPRRRSGRPACAASAPGRSTRSNSAQCGQWKSAYRSIWTGASAEPNTTG